MVIDEELRHRIGLALNEATLHDIKLDKKNSIVTCVFSLITLDKYGKLPDENRFQFVFKPVGRFVASCRKGNWNDKDAEIEKIELEKISSVIQSFGELQIYGWDFVNCGDEYFNTWKNKLSFDYNEGPQVGYTNIIDLFKEGWNRHIDVRIWFDDFKVFNSNNEHVELEEFLENGKRGWNAIYAGNWNNADKLSIGRRIKNFWLKLVGR